MSTHYACGDGETLVAYLYDELDPVVKAEVARHLAACAACRAEAAALGGVRQHLTEWTPPAPPLRFTIVSEAHPAPPPANVVRPAVPAWYAMPRWAQAVAATVALAVGLGAANVQVRHDATGWTFSTGWGRPAAPAVAAAPAIDDEARQTIAALQQQVTDLQAKQAAAVVPAAALASPDAISAARVIAMLEASERRQQQELAMRLTQVLQDFDMQRRADLMRVDQRVSQLAGQTRQAVTEQSELLKGIVRAGLRPPQ